MKTIPESLRRKYNKFLKQSQALEKERQKLYCYKITKKDTNESFVKRFSYRNYYFNLFNYYKNVALHLTNKTKKDDYKYTYLFLTFTAPGHLHYYYSDSGKRVRECPFGFEESIRASGEWLYLVWRTFYKRLKSYLKYNYNVDFIEYFGFYEMHKSFSPHLHILLKIRRTVSKRQIKKRIRKLFYKVIRKYGGVRKYNKFVHLRGGGQHAGRYVAKYISKTIDSTANNTEFVYVLEGWKKALGRRLFLHSNLQYTKEEIIKIYRKHKNEIKDINEGDLITNTITFIRNNDISFVYKTTKQDKAVVKMEELESFCFAQIVEQKNKKEGDKKDARFLQFVLHTIRYGLEESIWEFTNKTNLDFLKGLDNFLLKVSEILEKGYVDAKKFKSFIQKLLDVYIRLRSLNGLDTLQQEDFVYVYNVYGKSGCNRLLEQIKELQDSTEFAEMIVKSRFRIGEIITIKNKKLVGYKKEDEKYRFDDYVLEIIKGEEGRQAEKEFNKVLDSFFERRHKIQSVEFKNRPIKIFPIPNPSAIIKV